MCPTASRENTPSEASQKTKKHSFRVIQFLSTFALFPVDSDENEGDREIIAYKNHLLYQNQ